MKTGAKKTILFVDEIEEGNARVLPEKGYAFCVPLSILPDGAKEGMNVEISAALSDNTDSRSEIDSLLDELGSNL